MPLQDLLRQRTQAFAGSLSSHRILLYSAISTVAVSAAILNALQSYSNFYSVAIYLSKSSRSILANFGFLLALLCGHVIQQVFFGALRPPEIERLYDRLWFFITESLLAFTIFRDEFDIVFALMFGFLLFVKSFHWLAADRIEWMDQRPYPGPPLLFHIRMTTLFFILTTLDSVMFLIAVENTAVNGVGGMVLFASEYAILMASVMNTTAKYLLSTYELRRAAHRGGENAPPWENKSMWVFYIELVTDFLKLTTYLLFFLLIITFYGLPLNIVRDVYITARSFITRLRALHRYQTATRNMDQRYPNATEEEMSSMTDRTCIICREELTIRGQAMAGAAETPGQAPVQHDGPNTTPKKLPCGHIFHFHCLRSWLERQQSCPTCRRTVLDPPPAQQPVPGGAPVPPAQPGVLPQGNIFPPGAQNPHGLNNPFGFVGRLFGPGAHLQAPNAPPVDAQPPPQPPLVIGQQGPGVVIQYHIHYQLPRQQQQQPQNPAPQFAGFHGPGGVWQPWGLDARWFPDSGANAPQHRNDRGNSGPQTSPTRPQPESSPSGPASMSSSLTSAPQSPSNGEHRPLDPRQAAAAGAISENASVPPHPGPSTSPTPGKESGTQPSGNSTSSQNSFGSPVGGLDGPLPVPTLIPVSDPDILHISQLPPHLPAASPSVQIPRNLATTGVRNAALNPTPLNSSPYTVSPGPDSQRHARDPQVPISQVPPPLTDAQLALMDRVTREAIDERLRVLEGVSGAIYRCIDDLMRVRSSLPENPYISPQTEYTPSSGAPPNSQAGSSSGEVIQDASQTPIPGDPPRAAPADFIAG